ncbi:MAG: TonB-dependent receptor [Flavobacteriaceae bacterium]
MKHFFLFFILTVFCQAQNKISISGTITDSSNGETLLGATVYLQGTNIGTVTNAYGFFSLSATKGEYTLVVSYVGYETQKQTINLQADLKQDIELQESATALDEVVITAEEGETVNIKAPQMSVSKLSAQTIKQMPVVLGEVDVLKSIEMLPGVTKNGEGSSGFHVRGGAADQNLVLLDEAIIYNTSHFYGFFSVFNADAIKDIKLYKGDIPAKYGGRISSVLDIHQKDGNRKRLAVNGGIGLISSRLAIEAPLVADKSSILVAGRTSYAHLFMPLMEDTKDDKLSFYDLNLKTNYTFNKNNKLFLSGYFGRDVLNISSILENNYGNATGNLRWNHVFNDKLFSNLSFIYSKYDYRFLLDFIELDWTADISNLNLKYDFGYYVNNNLTLDFGFSALTYNVNPGIVKPSSETSSVNYRKLDEKRAFEGAFYASAEHQLSDKLSLNYGLRYSQFYRLGGQSITHYVNNQPVVYNPDLDIYERGKTNGETYYGKGKNIATYGNLEPRFGASYQLNGQSSVKASYTRSTQYLHLLSNTATVTPLDVWTPSGTYIKPQKSHQFAAGYYNNLNNSTYSLEIETYYKQIKNRVDYIDGSDLIGNNTIETEILNGEARAYGLEVLFRKNKGKLTGWLAYTLSKSEQRTLGGNAGGPGINNGAWYNTAYDRTHDLSLTGNYKLSEKWSISSNLVLQTGRPVTYPNGQYTYEGLSVATYSNRNKNRLPAYHRLDLAATYTPNKKPDNRWKGEWVFGIYNAYNRRNAASISFTQNDQTGLNEATRLSVFGIIPSVTYNFKF